MSQLTKDALNELVAVQRVKHASKLLLLTDNKALAVHQAVGERPFRKVP